MNGRFNNLYSGSYAPGAPDVFISDPQFKELWLQPKRKYIFNCENAVAHLKDVVGREQLKTVCVSGDKVLLTNQPLAGKGTP